MSEITALTMPKWGFSMEEGTLIEWSVNEGESFYEGDEIAEIESSKIIGELTARFAGTLRLKVAQEGDTLPIGSLLAVVAEPETPDNEIEEYIANFQIESDIPAEEENDEASGKVYPHHLDEKTTAHDKNPVENDSELKVPATSHARRLANKLGISLQQCQAAEPGEKISVSDVQAFHDLPKDNDSSAQAEQTDNASDTNSSPVIKQVTLKGMRKKIAERMQESKRVSPHYRLQVDCELENLISLRNSLNNADQEVDISVNDLLIKASGAALLKVPECNVQFDGSTISYFADTDIAIAVALDEGLMTPIVRAVNRKSVTQISTEMKQLIERARAGGLQQSEFSGGTFTISNLGMYGIKQFDAIINQPQGMILAVGEGEQRALVKDGELCIATLMTLSLSCDHRIIDGALGAKFLRELKRQIEQPELMPG